MGELAGEGLPELTDEELLLARAAALGADLSPVEEPVAEEIMASSGGGQGYIEDDQELLLPEQQQADTEADRRRRVIEERMKSLARNKPEIVARLLQTWISERRY
ncbi:MAG: hypothetical protein ACHQ7M_22495 [Chloroflexota bacterium]